MGPAQSSISCIAGVDSYTSRSLVSAEICSRLNAAISPTGDSIISFVDGSSTSILGIAHLRVHHQAVQIEVSFLVVRTVTSVIGADLLLGTDYMSQRGQKLILEFPPGKPTITQFVSAAVSSPEIIDGQDFTLRRLPSGRWSLMWQWVADSPDNLYKGIPIYAGKLKTADQRQWFDSEVRGWITNRFIVNYDQKKFGRRKCTLTWNPVVQTHKSTKVRPTLDYTVLNPYIKNTNFMSQSEVCSVSLRKWRKLAIAILVDVEKAYMNIEIDESLYCYQAVEVQGQILAMTRMGFGLSVAPRVLQCLIRHILCENKSMGVSNPYRDDIVIGTETDTAEERKRIDSQVQSVRETLLRHGLPTKPPVDLYDFSAGPTRALGLELFRDRNEIWWRRRSDSNWRLTKTDPTVKDLAGFIGRACPGHYPILGQLRPAALYLLSRVGKEAHANGWNALASAELTSRCRELEQMIASDDPTKGRWRIPTGSSWVLSTDASGHAMGCALHTREAWESTPDAECYAIEDHCWLVKNTATHINILELEAVIKSFNSIVGYLNFGDQVLLINDNKVVTSWLKLLLNDEKVETSGLYELLVRRRLSILREIFNEYKVSIQWVATDKNPADKVTRCPAHWVTPVVTAAVINGFSESWMERLRQMQASDEAVRAFISKFEGQNLIVLRDDMAFKRDWIGRTEILQLILPENVISQVVGQVHEELGHSGWKSTWIAMKRRFVSATGGLAKKVQKIISECQQCIYKNAKCIREGPAHHSVRHTPWNEIYVDTLQVSSLNETAPCYLLVIIDNYSKFVEATPLWSKHAEYIASAIETVLSRYGVIEIIRCDNGREFDNELVRNLAAIYNVKFQFGAVRNPQSQAPVERIHQTLLGIMRALMFGRVCHWITVLNQTLNAYRKRPHQTLGGLSPREVLLGIPAATVREDFNREEFWADIYDDIDEVEQDVPCFSTETLEKLSPGERVLVRMDQRRRIKTSFPWTPATVVASAGRGSYVLKDDKGRLAIFNQKMLSRIGYQLPFRGQTADANDTGSGVPQPPPPPSSEPIANGNIEVSDGFQSFEDSASEAPPPSPVATVPVPEQVRQQPIIPEVAEQSRKSRSGRNIRQPSRFIEKY